MPARTPCIVLAAAAFVAGCGDAPDRRQPAADTGSVSAAAAGSPTRQPHQAGDSAVTPVEVASITASAEVEDRPGGASIRVTLTGLEPEARYPVNVHEGPCVGHGRVSLPLGRITARPDGTGTVRMTVGAGRLPNRPFSVHVRDPSGSPVACAEVDPEPRDP